MELKSQIWIEYQIRMKVLIVPLWNWNADAEAFNLDDKFVLIVPLWNWNSVDDATKIQLLKVLIVPLWNWNENNQEHRTT